MEGWVKLWRQSIKKGWLKNHKLWAFWTYCLMKASGIETQEIKMYNQVKLERGQFIFGLNRASKDLNMSIQTLRTCIKSLEKWGNINRQSNNQFSVITILNYNSYNPLNSKANIPINNQLTSNQQSTNNQLTTLKKDKKVKNDNNKEIEDFFSYFLSITGKKFKFTMPCRNMVISRFKEGYTLEQLKKAVDNFMSDTWEGRKNNLDLIYCIGKQKNKPDNLEKWLNYEPKPQKKERYDG